VRKQSVIKEQLLCIVGLGALFSTMLLYSGSVIVFVTFNKPIDFIVLEAPASLIAAAVFAMVLMVAILLGKRLNTAIYLIGSPLYTLSTLSFAILFASNINNKVIVIAVALMVAFSNVIVCLFWGRVFSRFTLRQALINISIASAVSALVFGLLMNLPYLATAVLFVSISLLPPMLPWLLNAPTATNINRTTEETGGLGSSTVLESDITVQPVLHLKRTLRSLLAVAGMPIGGLVACSFCLAVMRTQFATSFDLYIIAVLVVVLLLLGFSLLVRQVVNLRALHMAFLPLFAILMLAAAVLTEQFGMGTRPLMFFIFLFYMVAAIIALITLTAVANAGEFSTDLVFTVALFLFAATSTVGQGIAELISEDMVGSATIVVTALYAIAALFVFYLRWFRGQRTDEDDNAWLVDSKKANNNTDGEQGETDGTCCQRLACAYQLTAREAEILEMLSLGHRGPFISEALFISPNTVRTHIYNIYRKLGVNSREDILRITHDS
jgi:DNA-binding CsgD family transcriptional regulator